MKKQLNKILAIATATMLLSTQMVQIGSAEDALTQDAQGFYPNASYTVQATDLDVNGNWNYRELVPSVDCETTDGFLPMGNITSGSTVQDVNIVQSSIAHSGNYSIKRAMRQNPGIAFRVPAPGLLAYSEQQQNEYILSSWMRTDSADNTSVLVAPACNYLPVGTTTRSDSGLTKGTGETSSVHSVNNTWKFVSKRVKIASADTSAYATIYYRYNNLASDSGKDTDTSVASSVAFQTLYIDDWSMRLAPPADFPSSYVKGVTPSVTHPVIDNNGKAVFTFSLDIDPRTVRKENISINGIKNSKYVKAVSVNTNDNTRETTLEITLDAMTYGTEYEIALPELLDAWGREVIGTKSVTLVNSNATDDDYTIFNDLDSSGKWKYRNLVPDEGCEALEGFSDKGTNDSGSTLQGNIMLNEDAHSGSYSLSRASRQNVGIGFLIDDLKKDEQFYVSSWLKSDCDGEDCTYSAINIARNYTPGTTAWEGVFDEKKFSAETQWKYFSKTVTNTTDDANTAKPITIYLYNADSTFGTIETISGKTRHIQNIYIDDWNFRRIPSFAVNLTGADIELLSNGKTKVTYTFDKDIDKWTVNASDILLNGEATSDVEALSIETDAITRKTALTVVLNKTLSVGDVVTLPNTIRDAWGREISGELSVSGISFGEIKLTNAAGDVFDETTNPAEGIYNFEVNSVSNNMAETQTIAAILALYDSNGKCIDVVIDKKDIASSQNTGLLASLNVAAHEDALSLKSFIWNMKSLSPYSFK